MGQGGINLLGGRHLLQALGLDALFFQQLEAYQTQVGPLDALQDQFQMAAGGLSPFALAGMLQRGIPGSYQMPAPNPFAFGGQGYAMPQTYDFGNNGAPPWSMRGLMGRMQGSMFERFLKTNPFARQQFEMAMGGRMIDDGSNDGRITMMPFSAGVFPAGGGNAYQQAMAMFSMMNQAVGAQSMGGAYQNGIYRGMMLSAFQNMLTQAAANGGGSPYVDWANSGIPLQGAQNPYAQAYSPLSGAGGVPFQPGNPSPTQPDFGIQPNDGSDTSGVLNDPSLTVEDKVTLLIMLIMKQMDKDIEKQAQYIDQLQKQQNQGGGGGGGKGKGGGGGGGGSDKSIDVETMKLKRLIDKRSQMFDMLRQIIDKYNQTAKGIIDSIGR